MRNIRHKQMPVCPDVLRTHSVLPYLHSPFPPWPGRAHGVVTLDTVRPPPHTHDHHPGRRCAQHVRAPGPGLWKRKAHGHSAVPRVVHNERASHVDYRLPYVSIHLRCVLKQTCVPQCTSQPPPRPLRAFAPVGVSGGGCRARPHPHAPTHAPCHKRAPRQR